MSVLGGVGMDLVDRLAADADIRSLKARYFRCLDTKAWTDLEAVFAPDLVADLRDSGVERNEALIVKGAAQYVSQFAPILERIVTVHHGHTPEIEIESATTARGVWAMEDKLWAQEGAPAPFRWMHGYGHYHETYVRLEAGWRIQTLRLTRLRVDHG
jgi:hypothetical protein